MLHHQYQNDNAIDNTLIYVAVEETTSAEFLFWLIHNGYYGHLMLKVQF